MKTRFSKNLLCLLLAAVLTVGTLTSCARNVAASAAESGITAAESGETAPDSAPKPSEKPKAAATPKPTEKPKSAATPKPSETPKATASPKPSEKPQTAQTSKTAQSAKPTQTAQAAQPAQAAPTTESAPQAPAQPAQAAPTTESAPQAPAESPAPTPAAESGPARCPICDYVLNPDGSCNILHDYGGYAFCTYDGTTVWVTCRVCHQSWPRDTLPDGYTFTLQHGIPCYEAHNKEALAICVCGREFYTQDELAGALNVGGNYYCNRDCALSTGFYCPICLGPVYFEGGHSPDCPNYTPAPAPETPAEPAPETPAEPAPETPAEPAPETPAEPAPETPAETTPETPAE